MSGLFSQFEWHRDNKIYYRLKHMLGTFFYAFLAEKYFIRHLFIDF